MITYLKYLYNQLIHESKTKKDIINKLNHDMPLHARLLLASSLF